MAFGQHFGFLLRDRHGNRLEPAATNRNLAVLAEIDIKRLIGRYERYSAMKMLRAIALVSLALVVAGCTRTANFQTNQPMMPQPTVMTAHGEHTFRFDADSAGASGAGQL